MAPMTRRRSPDGIPTDQVAEHYAQRAKGGTGLIISEGALIEHPLANSYGDVPYLKEEALQSWRKIVSRVHDFNTPMLAQIWHTGPVARPGIAKEAVFEDGKEVVSAATEADKRQLIELYSNAASVAKRAGFDGIELHCAHGYLLDSFLRAGDTGYVVEVLRELRTQVGQDLPICVRFSTWKVGEFEANYIDSVKKLESILNPLCDAGVDLFHPSVRRFWVSPFGEEDDLGLAGWTRKISGKPTITVGNIGLITSELTEEGPQSLAELQRRFDAGYFDLAALARPLITEPAWVSKAGNGDYEAIKDFYPEAPQEVY